ncbi:MAG: ATP-NAD kinase family protein [Thermoprotei archaeon]|nr:ATP-NAD kinase family protein [Thermoprotei archaeon]
MSREGPLGLIVNPLAGIGGRLGFKGSDGAAALKALYMGAPLVSPSRARAFLEALKPGLPLIAPPGLMGYDIVKETPHAGNTTIIQCVPRKLWPTTALDTRRCSRAMADAGVKLLVFVGGDGTARDVADGVDLRIPVLGVPSGVKVYSSVFSVNPKAAASIAWRFLTRGSPLVEREVLDVDEDEYRLGRLKVKLYGYMLVPSDEGLVEGGKSAFSEVEAEAVEAIAEYVVETMEKDTLYILGPGRTVEAIAAKLGVKKTPLGVDAVYNGRLAGSDLNERGLLELLKRYPKAKIIVSPIGGQGFILGRGNQQISPEVLKVVGPGNLIVVSTKSKLRTFKTLKVDTGDESLDAAFKGYIRVVTGYREEAVVKVE